jgi:hypothetical protein
MVSKEVTVNKNVDEPEKSALLFLLSDLRLLLICLTVSSRKD